MIGLKDLVVVVQALAVFLLHCDEQLLREEGLTLRLHLFVDVGLIDLYAFGVDMLRSVRRHGLVRHR